MSEFHFLRPLWLLALPVVLTLVWWHARAAARGGSWARVVDEALRPFVMIEGPTARGAGRPLLLAVAALLAVVALAGPTWQRTPVPVFREQSSLVIALDLSTSMNAADVQPSRLVRARYRIADLLRARRDGQTALVVFAAQAFVVTPLTDDTETLQSQLRSLDTSIMPSQGSEPAAAVELAAELVKQAGGGPGHVLLVTDGAEPDSLARAGAAAARSGLPVSVLAVGTAEGAPVPDSSGGFLKRADGQLVMSSVDDGALAGFAADHGGLFLDVSGDDSDLARFEHHLAHGRDADAARRADLASNQWREAGPWLLLPLLLLAALGFRRGVLFALLVCCLPGAVPPAHAGWWQTEDQAGARAFADGDYAGAGQSFDDPAWRGAARYRAGDYAGAAEDLAADDTARGHYNRGNALARQGHYDEALAAYDRALQLAPGDGDAAYNKELVQKLLEQQKQQQQSQDKRGKDDNQEAGAGERSDADNSQGEGGSQGGQPQPSDQARSDGDSGGEAPRQSPQQTNSKGDQGQDQAAEPAAPDDKDSDTGDEKQAAQAAQAKDGDESDAERAQATEQWLRQIPDDPGGLLRRKFQYLYKQRYGDQPYSGDRW